MWGRGTPAWTGETPHWAPHSSSGGCNKRLLYVTARDHTATQMSSVFIILECKSYGKYILYFLLNNEKCQSSIALILGFFKTKYRTSKYLLYNKNPDLRDCSASVIWSSYRCNSPLSLDYRNCKIIISLENSRYLCNFHAINSDLSIVFSLS